ncbi:uncharacterized protein LOC127857004 [Dreissena polymorpha]|uniref:C2H2-type domain-containing protein n=1 Tax=Dreissena polymorpha TaxID=45954 RepID=A0A9D3Z6D9_DREPO|nr:uncharacterized protein LOC127857004 [Dreissena polymorpha]XP_052249221.1 uncharacterized protein LOC127857004 [Dreissena polymorpha]KAH3711576.1 hypothetical protein DPMN_071247 [Dreissena polymorpha]
MIPKVLAQQRPRRRYRCKVCGKTDRKGRLIGHILKHHVPMDQAPFSCGLCNFRCTEVADRTNHITRYKRHVDEAKRAGVVDLSQILRKAENPVEVHNFMEADPEDDYEGIFEQDAEEAVLPDWLSQATGSLLTPSASPSVSAFNTVEKPVEINAISVARVPSQSPLFRAIQAPALNLWPATIPFPMPTYMNETVNAPITFSQSSAVRAEVNTPLTDEPEFLGNGIAESFLEELCSPATAATAENPRQVVEPERPVSSVGECVNVVQAASSSSNEVLRQAFTDLVNQLSSDNREIIRAIRENTAELRAIKNKLCPMSEDIKSLRFNSDLVRRSTVGKLERDREQVSKRHSKP